MLYHDIDMRSWKQTRKKRLWFKVTCAMLVSFGQLDANWGPLGRWNLNWEIASIWLDCGQVCMLFSWLMIGVEGVATHGQEVLSYTEIKLRKSWRTSQSASSSQGICFSSFFQAPAWCPWKMNCNLQAKEILSSPISFCLWCLSKQQET